MKSLKELKHRLLEIDDLNHAAALLRWDQSTYMPPGGAEARGRQTATLSRLAHEKLTDAAIGRLLDQAEKDVASLAYDSDEAALLRVARRSYDEAVRMPNALISEFNEHQSRIYQAWTVARPANDFATVQPLLEKTLELSRRMAECFPEREHIGDPLIAFSDYGMKASSVRALFADLRTRLVPIVRAVASRPLTDDSCVMQHAPEADQLAFGLQVIKRYGYDFDRHSDFCKCMSKLSSPLTDVRA